MCHVRLDGTHKRIRRAAIEKLNVDRWPPFDGRRQQAMHAIDHPHRAPIYKDRRQRRLSLGQPRDVRMVLPIETGGFSGTQRSDGDLPHLAGRHFAVHGHFSGAYNH